jgi:DUF971 family protein
VTANLPKPIEARRFPAEGLLRLTWEDGHAADYPYAYLRGWCPCAMCQGHGLGVHFHAPAGRVGLDSIEVVGNYALCLRFSDGHGTGIYRFDFLRDLCPCAACGGGTEVSR